MLEALKVKIKALRDDVLVTDMDFGEIRLASGIILRSDDGKAHGIKPRWGRVYQVGPENTEIKVGQWVLVEHGRWTRKIKINDGVRDVDLQRVETKSILAVSDTNPDTAYIGNEYAHGSSVDIPAM